MMRIGEPPLRICLATRAFANILGMIAASLSITACGVPLRTMMPRKLTDESSTS